MIASSKGIFKLSIYAKTASHKFRIAGILWFLICLYLTITSQCYGEEFGKNKVISQHFDWMTYKTIHFTIYYYPDAERLVRTMADAAEIAYDKIGGILEHDISKRTPLILYKSHEDFQQTNVILETIGEGVGGFAELLKYRVVIPFTGSIEEFQKVITHEVTHIFQYDILYKDLLAHIYTGEFLTSPPLWFIEGLSEYMADHWDAQGEMVLRDAVINNYIVPLSYLQDFSLLGSQVYLGYKEGQSAVQYLANKYGEGKISEILRELRDSRTKDMDNVLKNSIGIGLEEFDRGWQEEIKKRYWPRIADKQNPDFLGTNLTGKDNDLTYNTKPVLSPSGDLIAYITNKDGYDEIRIISANDGKLISRITEHLFGEEYNSIRDNGRGLAWSPDGDQIAFIGVRKDKDILLSVSVVTGEVINKIEMPFDAAYSPAWSPDSKQIAIVGLKDGRSDLYIFTLKDGHITQITSDAYDDNSPSWHPSEPKIAYSSERDGQYKIFILDLNTHQTQQVTYGKQNDISPSWTPDGAKIVFCSDMNSIYDVYTISTDGQEFIKLTNILTGCFNPSLSSGGLGLNRENSKLSVAIYHKGKSDIYVLSLKDLINEKMLPPKREGAQEQPYVVDDRGVKGVKYSLSFAPDIIYVSLGYISGGGFQNTIQFIGSDIMGDHRFIAGLDSISLQSQPNFLLAYYYLKKRPDVGAAIFNLNDFYIEGGTSFWQRLTGIQGYFSYPIDQFNRVDLQLGRYLRQLDYVSNEDEEDIKSETKSFSSLGISLVKDTIIWSDFGPYSGMRYNLSLEQTVKLSDRDLKMTNAIIDFRKYYRLGQRSNFSIRFIGAASIGPDKDKFYLGSSFSQSQGGLSFSKTLMRGYESKYLYGNRVGLLNCEIRIPFIDEIQFGWPFTWRLNGIRGILFTDFSSVWPKSADALDINNEPIQYVEQFKPWVNDDKGFRLVDIRSSVGVGVRIGLGLLSLSFDFAKKTDLHNFGKGYKFHFGLGEEF